MKETELRMEKSITALSNDLAAIRAGRANPAILDKVTVEYYGAQSAIQMVGNISVPEPRTLLISPFDPKCIPDIEKGIMIADIGITPQNDGKVVRLTIPQVTEERRKELVKTVKKMGEEVKVAVRNLRRDANDELKKEQKGGDLTEDDLKKELDAVQKITDKAIKEIDEIVAAKDKEIMEV